MQMLQKAFSGRFCGFVALWLMNLPNKVKKSKKAKTLLCVQPICEKSKELFVTWAIASPSHEKVFLESDVDFYFAIYDRWRKTKASPTPPPHPHTPHTSPRSHPYTPPQKP